MQTRSFRLEDDEYNFLKDCLDWHRAQKTLVKVGATPHIPNLFATQQTQTEHYANSSDMDNPYIYKAPDCSGIPPIVVEVIDGGAYPDQCECTKEEQAILYNPEFQALYKVYKATKDENKKKEIRANLLEIAVKK